MSNCTYDSYTYSNPMLGSGNVKAMKERTKESRCTQRGERGEGGTSCTPYKDFEKLPHKNAIKGPPPH